MYIFSIEKILELKRKYWVYLLGIILIFISASTGMLMAVTIFLMINTLLNTNFIKKTRFILKKKTILLVLIICLTVIFSFFINEFYNKKISSFINEKILDSMIFDRVEEKINKAFSSENEITKDRNLNMLFDNWEYIFLGAGEGFFERFNSKIEIHSTLPSILFYYGIFPTIILLYWIFINLKGLKIKKLSQYIALFVESFNLLNQRKLLFWVLILLANMMKAKDEKDCDKIVKGA